MTATTLTKLCPFCAEPINLDARKCRFCGEMLDPALRQAQVVERQPTIVGVPTTPQPSPGTAAVLSFLIPGLGQIYKRQVANGIVWFLVVAAGYAAFIVPGIILHICCLIGAAREA